jgi:hypothetical protein
MVEVAQRQSASATARAQAQLWVTGIESFRPVHGCFHPRMAARIDGWKDEEPVYPAVSGDLQAGQLLPATDMEGAARPEGPR